MNFLKQIQPGVFDIVVLILLLVGFAHGRKRGMSEELLDVFKWLLAVVISSAFYMPAGRLLAQYTLLKALGGAIVSYLLIVALVAFVFAYIKASVGKKLVGSDVFGRMEYYLGALAGMVRYGCMILIALSVLNAKFISDQDKARAIRRQQEELGSTFFPPLGVIQDRVFEGSYSGRFITRYLNAQIMQPVKSGEKSPKGGTIKERKQQQLDQVIMGPK